MNRQRTNIFSIFHMIAGAVMWVCLSACEGSVHEEEIIPAEGKTIEFYAPIDQPATKAAIEGTGFPVGGVFGIYAYQYGFNGAGSVEPFENPDSKKANVVAFNNTAVTNKGEGKLSYSPRVLWPESLHEGLSFFAYYPHSKDYAGIIHTEQNETKEQLDITYTVPSNASDHIDLMYAVTKTTSGNNPVNIEFNHALAQIKFQARVDASFPEGNTIKVTGIEITNAATQGILNPPSTEDASTAKWTIGETSIPLTIDFNPTEIYKSGAVYTSLEGEMLVIPQEVAGIEMKVTVTINGNPKTYTYNLREESKKWTINESLIYQLTVSWNGISVSSQVKEWILNRQEVVLDGKYYLKFSTIPTANFGSDGGEISLTCETNYDGKTGIGSGFILDFGEFDSTWCTVTPGENITPGSNIDSRQISIQCDKNTGDARETLFTLRAGNLYYQIRIKQSTTEWVTATPLTASTGNEYPINGQEHSFRLTASGENKWKVDRIEDPYQILLPSQSQVDGKLMSSWEGSTGANGTFSFYLKANVQPSRKATVIVIDAAGKLPSKEVVITAVDP